MREKTINAIVYCNEPQPVTGNRFLKFKKIPDNQYRIGKFLAFAAKFPGAEYVNFYHKPLPGETKGKFKERIYLQ